MAEFVGDRRLITQKVLAIINPEYTEEQLEKCMVTWWKNIRSTGGFGLTREGNENFIAAELEYWDFNEGFLIGETSAMVFSAKLDKRMIAPYYVHLSNKDKYIRVYDSRIAVMMTLYGNINQYLSTLEIRK